VSEAKEMGNVGWRKQIGKQSRCFPVIDFRLYRAMLKEAIELLDKNEVEKAERCLKRLIKMLEDKLKP